MTSSIKETQIESSSGRHVIVIISSPSTNASTFCSSEGIELVWQVANNMIPNRTINPNVATIIRLFILIGGISKLDYMVLLVDNNNQEAQNP